MNKHRAYWSAMHDADTGQSQQSKDYEKLRQDLKHMVVRFGVDEVAREMRKVIENERSKEC